MLSVTLTFELMTLKTIHVSLCSGVPEFMKAKQHCGSLTLNLDTLNDC